MHKIAIIGVLQQQAEALGTQFPEVYALYNVDAWNTNIKEMVSSDRVIYKPYSSKGIKQETIKQIKLLKEISPSVIYINSLRQLLLVGLMIKVSAILSRRPLLVATSHNSNVWNSTVKRIFIAILFNLIADGVITLGKFQELWLIKYGVPAKKIQTIANPVNTDLFCPNVTIRRDNDQPILINIGELNPLKNQETIIKALPLVKKEFPVMKLILTGGRVPNLEYSDYLNELISNFDLHENVSFVGYTEHDRIPQLLRIADISLISSLSEVCPFVVLESLASGKVTISTAVGGIPDLIKDGFNGFLLEPGDVEGFAKIIIKVLKNKSLRTIIELNARDTAVSNFSYQSIGKKHKEFISALVLDKYRRGGSNSLDNIGLI